MRKTLFIMVFMLLLPVCMFGQFTHVGIAAGYGTSVKQPGFGLYGVYTVNEKIKIAPSAMYHLPHKITTDDGTQTFGWWMINLDGNYIIIDKTGFQGYGLMGLSFVNITGEQDEVILGQEFKDKQSMLKLGLNIGAGLRFPISDKIAPFAELKVTLGEKADFTFREMTTTQVFLTAGILIRIIADKEEVQEEF